MRWFSFLCVLFVFTACSDVPPPLSVEFDKGLVSKEVIELGQIQGSVKRIEPLSSKREGDIVVLGQTGVIYLDSKTLEIKKEISFVDSSGRPIWFGVSPNFIEADDTFYISKGGGGFGETALLDARGTQLWNFHPDETLSPDKMIVADLNGDAVPEFYVDGREALYCLNFQGVVQWSVAGRFYDLQNVKNRYVLALTEDHKLLKISAKGEVLSKVTFPAKIRSVAYVPWNGEDFVVTGYYTGGRVALSTIAGGALTHFKLGSFPAYHDPQAITVKFFADRKPFLVILAHSRSAANRTQLSIYSDSKELVYREVIRSTRGLSAVAVGEREYLLVGDGTAGVLKYSAKSLTGF